MRLLIQPHEVLRLLVGPQCMLSEAVNVDRDPHHLGGMSFDTTQFASILVALGKLGKRATFQLQTHIKNTNHSCDPLVISLESFCLGSQSTASASASLESQCGFPKSVNIGQHSGSHSLAERPTSALRPNESSAPNRVLHFGEQVMQVSGLTRVETDLLHPQLTPSRGGTNAPLRLLIVMKGLRDVYVYEGGQSLCLYLSGSLSLVSVNHQLPFFSRCT
jgi:hypothetical protein